MGKGPNCSGTTQPPVVAHSLVDSFGDGSVVVQEHRPSLGWCHLLRPRQHHSACLGVGFERPLLDELLRGDWPVSAFSAFCRATSRHFLGDIVGWKVGGSRSTGTTCRTPSASGRYAKRGIAPSAYRILANGQHVVRGALVV